MATNVHRLRTTGKGKTTAYSCSCGGWSVTGSQSRDKGIRQAHSQHVSQAAKAPAAKAEPDGETEE
jgi:hypothetical protein